MTDYMHLNTIKPKAYDGSQDTSVVTTKRKAKAPMMAFGLFTADGLDGIEYTLKGAKREAKDLRDMGCEVRVYKVTGSMFEPALDMMHAAVRGSAYTMPTPKMVKGAMEAYAPCTITIVKL